MLPSPVPRYLLAMCVLAWTQAHPDVMNVMLQILEDGRLTDSQVCMLSLSSRRHSWGFCSALISSSSAAMACAAVQTASCLRAAEVCKPTHGSLT